MILSSIAAMARNRVIGKNNTLPWNLPEDMKFFRETTKGKIMIMGRKTFESFGKPLPHRFHIVISRNAAPTNLDPATTAWVPSLDAAIEFAKTKIPQYPEEVFIVGGGEIYRTSMDRIDRLYLTVIEQDFEGDTRFPEVDEKKFFLAQKTERNEPMPFSFRRYDRIR